MNDGNARLFSEKPCSDFWIEMAQTYPNILKMALKVLIPFPTTYECDSAFSALLTIKSKARNRLDVIHDMRVALSKTEPHIAELIAKKEVHPSDVSAEELELPRNVRCALSHLRRNGIASYFLSSYLASIACGHNTQDL